MRQQFPAASQITYDAYRLLMFDSPQDFEDFILDVIEEIVLRPAPLAEIIDWAQVELARGMPADDQPPPEVLRHAACQLTRMAWNVTPQPAHGFKVMKIADPGRNDKCVAGFHCKHKQCCGGMGRGGHMPPLSAEMGWLGVVEALPKKELDGLLDSGRLPDGMLHLVAARMLDTDPARVRRLIEPHFGGPLGVLKEDAAGLMLILCDAYDALGKSLLKRRLLERAAEEGRGAIKTDALQRLATMLSDKGDYDGAWQHFRAAQREKPDDPSLSHLEVMLLASEGRETESAERAKFWLAKLKRQGWLEEGDALSEFLRQAAKGGGGQAIARLSAQTASAEVERFAAAVHKALEQPVLPGQYAPAVFDEGEDNDPASMMKQIERQLLAMGIDAKQAREHANKLLPELKQKIASAKVPALKQAPDADGKARPGAKPKEVELAPVAALAALEADWHRAYPAGKPHSTHYVPQGDIDPWAPQSADLWIAFIEQHPECAQSPDIMDDWVRALFMLDSDASGWIVRELLPQIAGRVRQIIESANPGDALLPWGFAGNRPFLRLLADYGFEADAHHNTQAARDTFRLLLRLNPNDNHGVRDALVSLELAEGGDDAALEIIARYPDDGTPDLRYGAVLAWFRKGDMRKAGAALKTARRDCKKIEAWLVPARKAEPPSGEFGVALGGDEEAWNYRCDMREVWAATPGAFDWLKRT